MEALYLSLSLLSLSPPESLGYKELAEIGLHFWNDIEGSRLAWTSYDAIRCGSAPPLDVAAAVQGNWPSVP